MRNIVISVVTLLSGTVVMSATAGAASKPATDLSLTVGTTLLDDGSTVNNGTTVLVGTTTLLKEGTGARELKITLDPGMVYQAGGVSAPSGWTVEYSTDGTNWVTTEPSPASGVKAVRAKSASEVAGAVSDGVQTFASKVSTALPASAVGASTGGDGWDVFFWRDYLLNVYHHEEFTAIDCHVRSSGARCTGFDPSASSGTAASKFTGYRSGMSSSGWVDDTTGRLYSFTQEVSSNKVGVLCVNLNVSPPSSCGFTALDSTTNHTAYSSLARSEGIGGRVFGVETANKKLVCFDPVTNAACTGSPIDLGGASGHFLMSMGGKVLAKTDEKAFCFDAATLKACDGTWPAVYSTLGWTHKQGVGVEHTDATGNVDGVCFTMGCLNLKGESQTWTNPNSITTWATSGQSEGFTQYAQTNGRAYLHASFGNKIYCFDYKTNAACSDFPNPLTTTNSSLYALRVDAADPNCVWYNTHSGKIAPVDAVSGAENCTTNPVVSVRTRVACSASAGVKQWSSIKLNSITGTGTPSSIGVTVRDSKGATVSGWSNKSITVGGSVDLSTLDPKVAGSRPSFGVALTGISGGTVTAIDTTVSYAGQGPELCLTTVLNAGTASCPVTTGLSAASTDAVGTSETSTISRSLKIGTDATACPQNLKVRDPFALSTPTTTTVPATTTTVSTSKSSVGVAAKSTTATVSFTPTIDSSKVKSYQYSTDGGKTWKTVAVKKLKNGKLSFALSGLSSGEKYTVSIRAITKAGTKESQGQKSFLTAAQIPATGRNSGTPATTGVILLGMGLALLAIRRRMQNS